MNAVGLDELSSKYQALMDTSKNERAESSREFVAVIGIGCRFPGGIYDPVSFWEFIKNKKNGITHIPADRWNRSKFYQEKPVAKDKIYVDKGGFIEGIDLFDAGFFKISAKEAGHMDPQQRILLEVAWEALEDAGIVPQTLSNSNSGVYIGSFVHDYENMHSSCEERANFGAYSAVGVSSSILANRISHFFNFKGPSIVVDTACSSSLVSIHMACSDLIQKKSCLAIAGGINLIFKPEMSMILCNASMLSPDGYCKPFDEAANGYVRSEGVGLVVLKRLSEAIRDKDPIYCIIRGTGINQDGQTPTLTTPNGTSQRQLIRQTLSASQLTADDISYVEAHGTGTEVGDPIEANAIGNEITIHRSPMAHCFVGSVKSNFGHTESAAGVAGVIKTALMLKEKQIPPNIHFNNPNPNIDFNRLNIDVPTSLISWTVPPGQSRKAAVNSFGFGGTNAHAILEEYRASPGEQREKTTEDPKEQTPCVIPLSAKTEQSLKGTISTWISFLKTAKSSGFFSLRDIAYSAAVHKTHHQHRLTVTASSVAGLLEKVTQLSRCESPGKYGKQTAKATSELDMTFVFSGMGQQWQGMGKQLYRSGSIATEELEKCNDYFQELTSQWCLLDEIRSEDHSASNINETHIAQPCIFSLQVAFAKMWINWGISPARVIGHSLGEIAASHIAGVISLQDACKLVFHRSRLQHTIAGSGLMLAVGISLEHLQQQLPELISDISIAAINSPESVTLSGSAEKLDRISDRLNEKKLFNRFLNVDVPYHSSFMDPILAEFKESLMDLKPKPALIPFISTVSGGKEIGTSLDADYWAQNIRLPVLFSEAMHSIPQKDRQAFVEVSAHPVLAIPISECLKQTASSYVILPSLKRQTDLFESVNDSLGTLYELGHEIDWKNLFSHQPHSFIKLPSYAWHHQSFWNESEKSIKERTAAPALSLLGNRLDAPYPSWHNSLDLNRFSFLRDHLVEGDTVFPLAAYIQLIIEAAEQLSDTTSCSFSRLEVRSPLLLSSISSIDIQTSQTNDATFSIHSKKNGSAGQWRHHFSATMSHTPDRLKSSIEFPEYMQSSKIEQLSRPVIYRRLENNGLTYGPSFKVINHVWKTSSSILGEFSQTASDPGLNVSSMRSVIALDACFQMCALLAGNSLYLPISIKKMVLYASDVAIDWALVELKQQNEDQVVCDIICFNRNKHANAAIIGFTCQRSISTTSFDRSTISGILYQHYWIEKGQTSQVKPKKASISDLSKADIAAIHGCIETNSNRLSRSSYHRVSQRLDELAAAYWVELIRKQIKKNNGWKSRTDGMKASQLNQHKEYDPLVHHVIKQLEANGYIETGTECYRRVTSLASQLSSASCLKTFLNDFPEFHIEAMLIDLVGNSLVHILQGEKDPVGILFSDHPAFIQQFYRHSQSLYFFHQTLKTILSRVVRYNGLGKTLKILEIGAGTGGLTAYVAPLLDNSNIEYTYTDISLAFVHQAKKEFGCRQGFRFSILDLEKSPREQGFNSGEYDVILASSVLHIAADLEQSLVHVKDLLKPGGLLLFNEIVFAPFWVDAVFGIFKDWWRFSDFRKAQAHPIITAKKWKELLIEQGFSNIQEFSDQNEDPSNTILYAIKPATNLPASHTFQNRAKRGVNLQQNKFFLIITSGYSFAHSLNQQLITHTECCRVFSSTHEVDNCHNWKNLQLDQTPDTLRFELESIAGGHYGGLDIICLWEEPTDPSTIDAKSLENTSNTICYSLLNIVKAVDQVQWGVTPRLWSITFNAQAVLMNDKINIFLAPLWGARRVIVNEFPNLHSVAIDIGHPFTAEDVRLLCTELTSDDGADEIAYRHGRRFENRLLPEQGKMLSSNVAHYSLKKFPRTNTQTLDLVEKQRQKPGVHEVEIKVEAAALNFKDLAKAYALYKGDRFDPHSAEYGMECSGIVERVGQGVRHFQTGDRVYGSGWNCIGKYTLLDHRFIQPVPSHMSFLQATTIPIAYLTAYYSLHHLATITNDESVLIHSASGGVGLAAIATAKAAGAEVFVTAGSDSKRTYLQKLGAICVGSSRSLDFVDTVKALTQGNGLDIVINTLPNHGLVENIGLLKPNKGRLIDLSNLYNESSIPVNLLREGKSMQMFDLERMAEQQPDLYSTIFADIAAKIDKREYGPLPHHTFSIAEIASAFTFMAKSEQIGKVVISFDEPVGVISDDPTLALDTEATYLVAGGTSGFGFATAKWLFENGANYIVLVSRSGKMATEDSSELAAMIEKGAQISIESIDITNQSHVKEFIDRLRATHPPLKGIIHSAMVIDVALIRDLSEDRIKKVIDPKIVGSWNLYECTREVTLDFFIMYSSINSALGFAGQYNYAAANSFLDSFAHYLQSKGISAHSIGWSLLGEVGYFNHHQREKEHFRKEGFHAVTLQQAWKSVSHILKSTSPNVGVYPVEWAQAQKYHPIIRRTARFTNLLPSGATIQSCGKKPGDFVGTDFLTEEEKIKKINQVILESVGEALGINQDQLNQETSFKTFNFDSLTAVDLGVKLLDKLQVDIPKVALLEDGLTVSALTQIVYDIIAKNEKAALGFKLSSKTTSTENTVDLHEEATLPPDIRLANSSNEDFCNPKVVFLTGATGFLGAFILKELLDQSNADIHCLVRARNKPHAMGRIVSNLKQYHLWNDAYASRISPVIGDLSQPQFGLSNQQWQKLTYEIDAIYHNAAQLNFALPYQRLKHVNVFGTIEVIRLASQNKVKPLHYISTLIKLAQTCAAPRQLAEKNTTRTFSPAYDDEYLQKNGFNIGYHQSKWVAEELVLEADNIGLPISIYRSSLIAGDSRTGAWNTNDYICQLTKGIIGMAKAPCQDLYFDFCPVDYLSKSIVHLAQHPESIGMGYVLKHPNPITWTGYITNLNEFGCKIDLIDPDIWMLELHRLVRHDESNPLYSLLPLFEVRPLDRLIVATPKNIRSLEIIAESTTRSVLKKAGIECPVVETPLFETYFSFFKKSGLLP